MDSKAAHVTTFHDIPSFVDKTIINGYLPLLTDDLTFQNILPFITLFDRVVA